jgi:cobalt-precorrin 5A hydrolase
MGLDQAMIVAGIGCRAGTPAHDIEAALSAALVEARLDSKVLGIIATSQAKADEPGIAAAVLARGARLVLVPQHELEAAGARVTTRSERVLAITGVPSLAEAAALAAAGPDARLLVPRVAVGPVTCALAIVGEPT